MGAHDYDHLVEILREIAQPGDLVIGMGAGTITQWAYDLPTQLLGQENQKLRLSAGGAA